MKKIENLKLVSKGCSLINLNSMATTASIPLKRKRIAENILSETQEIVKTDTQKSIEDHCRRLHIDNHQTHIVEKRMRLSIEHGLTKEGHELSSVKCFPTYVRNLPTGKESGRVMALDLGGTNFRVLIVSLPGSRDKKPEIGPQQKFTIPKEVMVSQGTELLDYIARNISAFIKAHKLGEEKLSIGFTFSFPCTQQGLTSAVLEKWTKGFKCPEVVGKDVGKLLCEAIRKREELNKVDFKAILNDSTGCLMSCAWSDPKCRVGLIVGTGCNACYLESLDKVQIYSGEKDGSSSKTMVINTEWGAFGECGELDFILTPWDLNVDKESINPGMHVYEKMISGMYMGEIVRHVLKELADKNLIFKDVDVSRLSTAGTFETRHACEVERDPIGSFDRCRAALKEVLKTEKVVPKPDCYAVRFVCEEVSRRACMLIGAGIAALLRKMDYKDVVIAVDGTLFRNHPLFYCMVWLTMFS